MVENKNNFHFSLASHWKTLMAKIMLLTKNHSRTTSKYRIEETEKEPIRTSIKDRDESPIKSPIGLRLKDPIGPATKSPIDATIQYQIGATIDDAIGPTIKYPMGSMMTDEEKTKERRHLLEAVLPSVQSIIDQHRLMTIELPSVQSVIDQHGLLITTLPSIQLAADRYKLLIEALSASQFMQTPTDQLEQTAANQVREKENGNFKEILGLAKEAKGSLEDFIDSFGNLPVNLSKKEKKSMGRFKDISKKLKEDISVLIQYLEN